jgi:outer membrane lipoprotein
MKYLSLAVLLLIFLYGCASNIPLEIRQDITEHNISINAASTDFDQYQGQNIRWGGTIVSVENKKDDTWIEVVGKDLNSWGEPVNSDNSEGRFLVRVDGFLDPAIYKTDRRLTVYGTVESRVMGHIDDHPYTYPLIKAQSYYLWSDYDRRRYYGYPYYPYYYPYRYGFDFGYGYGYGFYPRYGFGLHHFYYW